MYGFLTHGAKELIGAQKPQKRYKRHRISRRFKQRLFWRDEGRCVYCGTALKFSEATIDHITPMVRSGRHRNKENMAISCFNCNKIKGPLVLDPLADLAPDALWLKFKNTCESVQKRKGHYVEWITSTTLP